MEKLLTLTKYGILGHLSLTLNSNNDAQKHKQNMLVIQEYNANLPLTGPGPNIRERKVVLGLFDWLQVAWSNLWEAKHGRSSLSYVN